MRFVVLCIAAYLSGSVRTTDNPIYDEMSVYRTSDNRKELIIYKSHYFLGTINHATDPSFIDKYGLPLERENVNDVQCISLGIFKFAKFARAHASCKNVHIQRKSKRIKNRADEYVGTCYDLSGDGCSPAKGTGRPALIYSYRIDGDYGVTAINFSSASIDNNKTTFLIKSGPGIFGRIRRAGQVDLLD